MRWTLNPSGNPSLLRFVSNGARMESYHHGYPINQSEEVLPDKI
jgi:hypothetical protein